MDDRDGAQHCRGGRNRLSGDYIRRVDEAGLATLLVGVTLVAWFTLEVRQALQRRSTATHADRGSLNVLRATTIAGLVLAVVATHAVPGAAISRVVATFVGLALLWSGVAVRAWSFRTLGAYFTFTVQTSPDQPLITDGPYRCVRHPGYLGMVLALLGVALLLTNWLGLLLFAVPMLAGLGYRIRVEELALEDELGDRWRDYARGRSRLVPLVW
jgi:protein-S-isoprenylcysteine O-methyltransferase Ste14